MVNEEKVRLMTKLAMYEDADGKKEIPVASYFQSDYISYHVIKTAIFVTIAYLIILGLWAVYKMDYILANLNPEPLTALIRKIVIIYVIILAVYLVISYFIYRFRYRRIRKDLKEYYHLLKQLNTLYDQEEQRVEIQEPTEVELYDDVTGI